MLYNLGFRVLLGRLCADKKDCYNSLPQMDTFPISSLRENKIKLKKNSYGCCTISAFVCFLEDFVPIRRISIIY